MSDIKRIAKNTGFLFISQIVSLALGFLYFMYTARYLGVENFGVLSFALAFTGIFGLFINFGFNTLIVMEVSRNRSMATKYIENIAVIKVILAIPTLGLMTLIINLLGYPTQTTSVVNLIALSVFLGSFTNLFYSIFQAYEKMEYQSFGSILNSVLMLVGTLFAISKGFNVVYFALIYVLVSVIVLVYSLVICTKRFAIPRLSIDWNLVKVIFKKSLPFGLSMIFVTIYYWIDSVMLSIMIGDEVVGLYNAAYRLIMTLLVIPSVLNIVVFPAMSRFYITATDSLLFVHEKYFKYMAVIGFPIGMGTTLLADKIILQIFGVEYINSAIALQILVWSSVFVFLAGSYGRLLESSNKQIIITKITGICAFENVILNLLVIPKYSYVGTSATTMITEFTVLLLCIYVSSKTMGLSPKNNLLSTVKPILASLGMSIFIIYFKYLNLLLLVLICIVLYFVILYVIKGFDDTDISLFKKIRGSGTGDNQ